MGWLAWAVEVRMIQLVCRTRFAIPLHGLRENLRLKYLSTCQ